MLLGGRFDPDRYGTQQPSRHEMFVAEARTWTDSDLAALLAQPAKQNLLSVLRAVIACRQGKRSPIVDGAVRLELGDVRDAIAIPTDLSALEDELPAIAAELGVTHALMLNLEREQLG